MVTLRYADLVTNWFLAARVLGHGTLCRLGDELVFGHTRVSSRSLEPDGDNAALSQQQAVVEWHMGEYIDMNQVTLQFERLESILEKPHAVYYCQQTCLVAWTGHI